MAYAAFGSRSGNSDDLLAGKSAFKRIDKDTDVFQCKVPAGLAPRGLMLSMP